MPFYCSTAAPRCSFGARHIGRGIIAQKVAKKEEETIVPASTQANVEIVHARCGGRQDFRPGETLRTALNSGAEK